MKFPVLRGFRDYPPPEAGARSELLRRIRSVARRCGFQELEPPSVESLELYREKSGDEIVRQLWAFTDKGGREVALSPESTPSVARIFAGRAKSEPLPVKWFTASKHWRYEEPQAGRAREFLQVDFDILGVPGIAAESELLATAALLLDEAGAEGLYAFRVNERKLSEAAGTALGVTNFGSYLRALDRHGKIPDREFQRELEGSGLPESSRVAVSQFLKETGAGFPVSSLEEVWARYQAMNLSADGSAALGRLRDLFASLERVGLGDRVVFHPGVVRGFAYYTGMVFEAFDRQGDLRSLFGGGRYDHLIELFAGPPTPAVGLAIGDQTLELLLKRHDRWPAGEPPLDTYVVAVTDAEAPAAAEWVSRLRRAGVSADRDLLQRSMSRQLKEAARRRARRALLLGLKEAARGVVVERDLATGAQRELTPDEVLPSA